MVAQLSCALIKANMNDSCIWCCKETFSLTNKQTSQQEHYSIPVTMSSWFWLKEKSQCPEISTFIKKKKWPIQVILIPGNSRFLFTLRSSPLFSSQHTFHFYWGEIGEQGSLNCVLAAACGNPVGSLWFKSERKSLDTKGCSLTFYHNLIYIWFVCPRKHLWC